MPGKGVLVVVEDEDPIRQFHGPVEAMPEHHALAMAKAMPVPTRKLAQIPRETVHAKCAHVVRTQFCNPATETVCKSASGRPVRAGRRGEHAA